VVAIGASTGGPNALQVVLQAIPESFGVPIVIVQHMPENFTHYLASRLDSKCSIRVHEAAAGDRLAPGHAWLAQGNHHMELKRSSDSVEIVTTSDAPVNSCRPSVDVLLKTVVGCYGAAALAVILTGMGQDGLRGSELVRAAGGRVLAQDQATSVVWGMPGQVANAGLAEAVLPIDAIGGEIVRRVTESRA
jgi:two-component system chemotaxis response regulator CheB